MPWELGGSAEVALGYYWIRWICKWCFRVSVCTYESSGETIAGIYQALHVVLHCTLCCRKLIRCSRDLGATLSSPMECEIRGVEAGGSIWHFLRCLTITCDMSLPYNICVATRVLKNISSSIIALVTEKGEQDGANNNCNILVAFFFNFTYQQLLVMVIRGSSFGLQIGNQGWSWLGYRTKETRSWDHTGMDRSVSSGHGWNILLTTEKVLLQLQPRKTSIWSMENNKRKREISF